MPNTEKSPVAGSLPIRHDATDAEIHERSLWLARQRHSSWARDEDLPKIVREYGDSIRENIIRAVRKGCKA